MMKKAKTDSEHSHSSVEIHPTGRPPDPVGDPVVGDPEWELDMEAAALTLNALDDADVAFSGKSCAFVAPYFKPKQTGHEHGKGPKSMRQSPPQACGNIGQRQCRRFRSWPWQQQQQ